MIRDKMRVFPVIAGAIAVTVVSLYVFKFPLAAVSCLLGWTMLLIAASDAVRYIIPDTLSLPSIPLGLLVAYVFDETESNPPLVLEHLGAALFGAALLFGVREAYYYWRGREGLGLGDVKLGAVAGAWTGFQGMTNALLVGCLLAISYVAILSLWQRRLLSRGTPMAFGVFFAPAIWLVWCWNVLHAMT